MESGKKKRFRKVVIIFAVLIAGIFFLNYFLASRLERYLKQELVQRVSEATDGFYTFSFDGLSINLFNGELQIEGIDFKPDSLIFSEWEALDSLPDNYFKVKAESIDFKGVNLIWRFSYRELHFNTFEIKAPDVEIFDAYYSDRFQKKRKNTNVQTLYELIEPYIDVLSVQALNLVNASVSYTVEHPLTPIIYAMKDASFHAYGFWLDKESSQSGKLLYADNFDFFTNQPQQLLTNNDFSLHTDSIRLSTRDSIIYIENIHLVPQSEIWEARKRKPKDYVEGQIEKVEVKGIAFRRENALNYLKARAVNIQSSDIHIFSAAKDTVADKTIKNDNSISVDSLVQSLSIYEIISPVLRSVAIGQINLEKTKAVYSLTYNDSIEVYQMENFDFHAFDFRIDSVLETDPDFWYSKDIAFEATNMEGLMTARNHKLQVGRLALDTRVSHFTIEDIKIEPLSVKTRNDYLWGSIDSLNIDGLVYKSGISAKQFKIDAPNIRYIKAPSVKQKESHVSSPSGNERVDVDAILNPLFRYLFIENIAINKANFTLVERGSKHPAAYQLKDFDFFATHFLVDESTGKNKELFFEYNDLGFNFRDFDNYISEKDYRLTIQDASFSTVDGFLRLENVKLIPQESLWDKAPATYIHLETPLIYANGLKDFPVLKAKQVKVDTIHIESPDIRLIRTAIGEKKNKQSSPGISIPIPFDLFINEIGIDNINLKYNDRVAKNETQISVQDLALSDLKWDKGIQHINMASLLFNNTKFASDSPEAKTVFELETFRLDTLAWSLKENSSLTIGALDIINPMLTHIPSVTSFENAKKKPIEREKKSIYQVLGSYANTMSLGAFNIVNADIDIRNTRFGNLDSIPPFGTVDLSMKGLQIHNKEKEFSLDDLGFKTSNLSIPVDNGFFTLRIGNIDFNNRNLTLNDLSFVSPYPQMEFAYRHPKNADWFDIRAKNIYLEGIDLPYYFSNNILKLKYARIDDAVLKNYRNQKLPLPHKIVPMIYEGIQKAPLKFDIDEVRVNNLEVVYDELAKKGNYPGRIFFTDMNGTFHGFTNVASFPGQFIRLEADAKLMGDGFFTATWWIPVDTLNDRFLINAHLPGYDLTTLNNIITPLAPARVRSGRVTDLTFEMDASSKGANIDMLLLYENLKADYMKEKDGELVKKKFITFLINLVVRDNNPNRENGKPRHVNVDIVRDPYHSTFNYLWQMLRPSVTESVGISKGMQNFAAGVMNVINKIKNFFGFGSKEKETDKEEANQ